MNLNQNIIFNVIWILRNWLWKAFENWFQADKNVLFLLRKKEGELESFNVLCWIFLSYHLMLIPTLWSDSCTGMMFICIYRELHMVVATSITFLHFSSNILSCVHIVLVQLYSSRWVSKNLCTKVEEMVACDCIWFNIWRWRHNKAHGRTRSSKFAMRNVRATAACKTVSHTQSTHFYWLDKLSTWAGGGSSSLVLVGTCRREIWE